MNFKNENLKISYTNKGSDTFVSQMVPLFSYTKTYKRAVGYFSTSVFNVTYDNMIDMFNKGGKMQLITSPILSREDIDAISLGMKLREDVIQGNFINEFEKTLLSIDDFYRKFIIEMISKNNIDIKIVSTLDFGQYHDKIGIMEDYYGNTFTFVGSPNESLNGFIHNYEKIRLNFSWDGTKDRVQDEIDEFDEIWNGKNKDLTTYNFDEAIKKSIFKIANYDICFTGKNIESKKLEPRQYQKEAISSWASNNYIGFYLMATGTGKTLTTLFGIENLLENKGDVVTVIAAPYIHLIDQWGDDVSKIFPESNIIKASSKHDEWLDKVYKSKIIDKPLFIIITLKGLVSPKFYEAISTIEKDKLLVIDEAHRFSNNIDKDFSHYKYKLGLSATPYSGYDKTSGNRLISFFDKLVYEYGLEEAIENNFLVEYNYFPIFIESTDEEVSKFNKASQMMASCFSNTGKLIKTVEQFSKYKQARLRVISSCINKIDFFDYILDKIKIKENFIVYCGDGKVWNNNEEETRIIEIFKKKLNKINLKTNKFTCVESRKDRIEIIKSFNKKDLQALVAIKCLDEGINIPSIKSALILSSNDDPREFIQRRGRILRLFTDENGEQKKVANIYDVIVLPSIDCDKWVEIEFRRFVEYNRLAKNKSENNIILQDYIDKYSVNMDKLKYSSSKMENEELDDE